MIIIQARPYKQNFSGNNIYYKLYSAAAAANTDNYFEVRVLYKLAADDDFSVLPVFTYTPVKGLVNLNLKDIINAQLKYHVPSYNETAVVVEAAPAQHCFFYIQFREITTTALNPAWDDTESEYERIAYKGGLHPYQFRYNNYFHNYHSDNKDFLTWQVRNRLAGVQEHIFLAYLHNENISSENLRVFCRVYFTDETFSDFTATGTFSQYAVHFISAGFLQWGMNLLSKKVWYWQISVQDISIPASPVNISEIFTYELDNRNDYNAPLYCLHYRNSLGGLDSVRLRGIIQKDLQYTLQAKENILPQNYFDGKILQAEESYAAVLEDVIYKADAGWLEKEEQERLRDAFLQREVYWLRQLKYWPVKLIQTQFTLNRSDDFKWGMPIEFKVALNGSDYYTPDINVGDGEATDNIYTCVPQVLLQGVSFGAGNTIAYASWTVAHECADNPIIYQWKNADAADWNDQAFSTPLITNHAVNKNVVVLFRAKRNDGERYGPEVPVGFSTFVSAPTTNSTVSNSTSHTISIEILINNISYGRFVLETTQTASIEVADAVNATVLIRCFGFTPTSATLTSNTVDYDAVFGVRSVRFNNVNIVNGFNADLNDG